MGNNKIINEEEKLTFVTVMLGKLNDKERESVIKFGGDLYHNGFVDGCKTMLKAGIAGIILELALLRFIENKMEAKKKPKIYSYGDIYKESKEKGERNG